jgi:predicted nucleic acid-binding protein
MIIVLDANVYLALFADLAYSQQARAAVADASEMIAPDLIRHETANTLWKLAVSGAITTDHAADVIDALETMIDEIAPASGLTHGAFALAMRLNHPAYDCFYMRLAIARGAKLVTADRRLARAAESIGSELDCQLVQASLPAATAP